MTQEEKKAIYDAIMQNLFAFIGQKITVIYWEKGKLYGLKGNLDSLVAYDYINMEGLKINFVGSNMAIQAIASEENKMLYYNGNTEHYQGFPFNDVIGLIAAQEKLLGYSVERKAVFDNNEPGSGRK